MKKIEWYNLSMVAEGSDHVAFHDICAKNITIAISIAHHPATIRQLYVEIRVGELVAFAVSWTERRNQHWSCCSFCLIDQLLDVAS